MDLFLRMEEFRYKYLSAAQKYLKSLLNADRCQSILSMKIDGNRYLQRLRSSIFIDFRYQSINCYWLISITIDFIDYRISSIGQAASFSCGVHTRTSGFQNVRGNSWRNFGHEGKLLSDGNVRGRETKKDTSEQTSRGMNANENDLKSGGRINTKLNTQGYYVSLWRKMC